MPKNYPEYRAHLSAQVRALAQGLPGTVAAFGQLHDRSLADGALSGKVKELMALAIGITSRCEGCIAYHVHDALKAGATRPEILETIGVALMMGGGPAAVYGCEALDALQQFEAAENG